MFTVYLKETKEVLYEGEEFDKALEHAVKSKSECIIRHGDAAVSYSPENGWRGITLDLYSG